MNYGEIKEIDIANGIGVRVSLFVSGCTHHCKGCFNEMTWDFNYGKPFTKDEEDRIIELLKPAYVTGFTILGGEPMEPSNQAVLRPFLERVKEAVPDKTIWVYSGYTWEELINPDYKRAHTEDTIPMLQMIDILVDGEFMMGKKNLSLRFRGSENQRILDVRRSLTFKKPILSEYM
ncbi:MAG: anaerobic ribonucleoside-triphosphate reductase activating protein [Butyrivibrio sp.]|nr:anaerobic ribonucleoside-triphosphate reductase activating protein [Butyrivibrio sp.]